MLNIEIITVEYERILMRNLTGELEMFESLEDALEAEKKGYKLVKMIKVKKTIK